MGLSLVEPQVHPETALLAYLQAAEPWLLKAVKEKQLLVYRGVSIRLIADFSSEAMEARKQRVIQSSERNTINQEFCISQNNSSIIKKLRHFQIKVERIPY